MKKKKVFNDLHGPIAFFGINSTTSYNHSLQMSLSQQWKTLSITHAPCIKTKSSTKM